eukprot:CAMPEP_0206011696 /NCGR_PEP_ID=MMETSP1464-20131121/13677_1 /ASSEMBLY_ACC=CAM_ASM_001124 /TAXON_ID=119497 /ORGANISM="Exanthemachrysis gayraliae, Strain RCC1523" /LENGTH=330 /DNA_ID=CAMNT_0053385375 /DNA_START=29 /DNA_END=1018 /DNA_ORIENTATION=+
MATPTDVPGGGGGGGTGDGRMSDDGGEGSSKPVKPKMVKQYMMGEILGEGSFGKVREAIDSETLRRVAVKKIDRRRLRKARGAEEQVRREIAVQRGLKHKHIVELIETIQPPDKPDKMYIVLELVHGGSLQDLLTSYPDGRLPLGLCHRLTGQLLDALEYLHSKGVVHRDVKPANLMVTRDGMLKISDFGSAETVDQYASEAVLKSSSGSPAFHPPEVAMGAAQTSGFKVDVWAAGVTLFLLATGTVPFSGASLLHLYDNIGKGQYEEPESLKAQPALCSLIRGMLTVNTEERFTVAQARAHVWLTEPEPQWEAEVKAAIAEIGERVRAT